MNQSISRGAPRATTRKPGVELVLPQLVCLIALSLAAAYLVIAVQRVLYPFDLDLVEEGMVMQALRVAGRQPVFLPPNAEFVPQVYMPLYTWLGGLVLRLTGPSYLPLRLLSLIATLGTAAVIFFVARREAGDRWLAVTCASLYLAGYRIVGGWYDLARVDSLFVALAVAGVALAIYHHRSTWGLAGAAVLMCLSFLTKQQGLAIAAVVGLYLVLAASGRAWRYAAVFGVPSAAAVLALQGSSDGWFGVYTFGIAFASPLEPQRLARTIALELGGDMAVLSLCLVLLWVVSLARYGRAVLVRQPWLLFITAFVLIAAAGRTSVGGARNQLIPAYAVLCLSPALLWREVAAWRRRSRRATTLLAVGLLLQAVLAMVGPAARFTGHEPARRYRPSAAMRAAGERFISWLSTQEGDPLVMMHPFYSVVAGKAPHVHIQGLWHARWRGRDPLPRDLESRIRQRVYPVIVSDDSDHFETEPALLSLIEAHYSPSQELAERDAPATLSGIVVRPRRVFTPRQPATNRW
jgi:hypothetical protein